MMQKVSLRIKRALLCAFFFILNSCSSCPIWQFDCIRSFEPCFQSARIYYEPKNVFREAGVELANSTTAGFSFFLNFYGCPLPDAFVHENIAEITLFINSTETLVCAHVCQGNQKLLLSEDATQLIIQSILNNDEVRLKIWRYSVLLPNKDFEQNYQRLLKI